MNSAERLKPDARSLPQSAARSMSEGLLAHYRSSFNSQEAAFYVNRQGKLLLKDTTASSAVYHERLGKLLDFLKSSKVCRKDLYQTNRDQRKVAAYAQSKSRKHFNLPAVTRYSHSRFRSLRPGYLKSKVNTRFQTTTSESANSHQLGRLRARIPLQVFSLSEARADRC